MAGKTKGLKKFFKESFKEATLICGCDKDSRKAFRLLEGSHMPFLYVGISKQTFEGTVPCLLYGLQEHEGLEKIERFVKRWRNKNQ